MNRLCLVFYILLLTAAVLVGWNIDQRTDRGQWALGLMMAASTGGAPVLASLGVGEEGAPASNPLDICQRHIASLEQEAIGIETANQDLKSAHANELQHAKESLGRKIKDLKQQNELVQTHMNEHVCPTHVDDNDAQ
ncbi:hypothetical protein TI39_contig334g00012 [Zymoseptoria brevis]|uniref:Uncharacterized protein n=1 Tax=Zymoseptoria brevis TaxID=1047168 RepID=A0A0F4GSC7_9PEZI|nr:hypothetical protein TI39_contig334g00012 [Zymoseptoria brevis]